MNNWRKYRNFRKVENPGGPAGSFKYIIRVSGQDVEVGQELYREYATSSRKMEYMEFDLKRDRVLKDRNNKVLKDENGLPIALPEREVSLEMLISEGWDCPDDGLQPDDDVIQKMEFDELHHCLGLLSDDERALIKALFFDGMTEREYSMKSGIAQKTINDRKHRVLAKLKNLMQKL
jgi:RNA polymerase sigma factor (sigma-70 family)